MSIKKLTTSLEALTKQESDFSSTESTVIKLLSSDKFTEQLDSGQIKVDELLTLVESVTNLRRLVHVQLRSLLLELRDLHTSPTLNAELRGASAKPKAKLSSGSASGEPILKRDQLDEIEPARIEKQQPTPKPLLVTENPLAQDSEPSSAPPPAAPPFTLDETPLAEDLEDLEDLKREVAFLTSPNLNLGALDDAELAPTLESGPAFPFDLDEISIPSASEAKASAENHADDFSSAFPDSAGEAGTAIFNIEEYRAKQEAAKAAAPEEKQSKDDSSSLSQESGLFAVDLSTPHTNFTAEVIHFSETELILSTEHSLLRGEEVSLSFVLPNLTERIECKGLVRPKRSSDLVNADLCIRFLNLRPTQQTAIREELS